MQVSLQILQIKLSTATAGGNTGAGGVLSK
jgi:hypothetical protein